MECANEMVTLPVTGIPAPCTPSPQPGDKPYVPEEEDLASMCDGGTQLPMGMAQMKGTTPQLHAVPQMYAAQYYPYSMPTANTGHYGPTVMYMPMTYYHQQYRPNAQTYPVDYTTAAQQPQPAPKAQVETPTIVKTPGRQRVVIWNFCQFCQNNKESESYYRSHILRDAENRVVCPVLRAYNCPICNNGGGDNAHTKSYCPQLRTTRLPRRTSLF